MKELPLTWSDLTQGIKDEEVLGLQQYIHTGIKYEVLSAPPFMFLFLLGQWLYNPIIWGRALPCYLLLTLVSVVWYFFLNSSKVRDPSLFHVGYIGMLLVILSLQGWFDTHGQSPFPNGAFIGLAANVLICPMSPKRYLQLGLITIAGESLAVFLTDGAPAQYILKILSGGVTTFYVMLGTRIIRVLLKTRAQSQHQQITAERLSTMGRHTANIAHELKTPLANANLGVYAIEHLSRELQESIGHPDVNDDDLREIGQELQNNLNSVKEGLDRSINFVNALREHTQQMNQHHNSDFSPQERLETLLLSLRTSHSKEKVNFHLLPFPHALTLVGDARKFDQLVLNLINNAIEAGQQAKTPLCEIMVMPRVTSQHFILSIQDNGPGVPEHLSEQIFAPMFTTKGHNGGTGLGLSMCRDIAEGFFGGALDLVESTIGARFALTFPLQTKRPTRTNTLTFNPFPKPAAHSPTHH